MQSPEAVSILSETVSKVYYKAPHTVWLEKISPLPRLWKLFIIPVI